MSRREPYTQYRFIINIDSDHLEVHDLDHEYNGCRIDEISTQNFRWLKIDNTKDALEKWLDANQEYDGCEHCLEEYHSK